ncbi:pyridoxine 5'-phosphate synthase, partial [Xenorhabdus bovienii]|uniref:pyridoxine 5'-phosphate synthase n=1 Tax=Xenorhabdus bovienii TaxID=40576 RepID=UPI0030C66B14
MVGIATQIKPAFCCLVPEKRQEVTTEGGLDVLGQKEHIIEAVKILSEAGILVSLFIDADPQQIDAAVEVGAPFIEIHTGAYADAEDEIQQEKE